MRFGDELRARLRLPLICAPMFLVSNPQLVIEACRAGVMGSFPKANVRSREALEVWLRQICEELATHESQHPAGPLAVNLSVKSDDEDMAADLELCRRFGVELIISSAGDPTKLISRAHGNGLAVFHDVTSVRFAEKAIAAGADGLIAICAGGGGQSGTISPLIFVPQLRRMCDGVIVLAGGVASGMAIRAAEALGADLAYLGTPLIATRESSASEEYKRMLVESGAADIVYTDEVNGVPASWLAPSLARYRDRSQEQSREAHHAQRLRPWRDVWSAGQGVEFVGDIPPVSELIERLHKEYQGLPRCSTSE